MLLVFAEIPLDGRGPIPADGAVYILLEKMIENDPVAESFLFWLYQLDRRFIQDFEKASADLSLACELRATLTMRALSYACFARRRRCPIGINPPERIIREASSSTAPGSGRSGCRTPLRTEVIGR